MDRYLRDDASNHLHETASGSRNIYKSSCSERTGFSTETTTPFSRSSIIMAAMFCMILLATRTSKTCRRVLRKVVQGNPSGKRFDLPALGFGLWGNGQIPAAEHANWNLNRLPGLNFGKRAMEKLLQGGAKWAYVIPWFKTSESMS